MTFINEGPELQGTYGQEGILLSSSGAPSESENRPCSGNSSYPPLQPAHEDPGWLVSPELAIVHPDSISTPVTSSYQSSLTATAQTQSHTLSPSPRQSLSTSIHSPSRWALQTPQEALLMQHFIHVLASWFDLFDPHKHFAVQVPYRATTCSTLRKAVFALSARHLAKYENIDEYLADRYYEECIEELIPMIDQTNTVLDEGLLCATVILRLLEELDGMLSIIMTRLLRASSLPLMFCISQ